MYYNDQLILDIDSLCKNIVISEKEKNDLEIVLKKHAFSTTKYYLSLIDSTDIHDPIKKIQIPNYLENLDYGSYDTSGEARSTVVSGLQHKYTKTALLLITNQCPSYCRYCFRKRLIGIKDDEIVKDMDAVIKYLKEHTEIDNVLISGGDSLWISNDKIRDTLERLSKIDHLRVIRFGTKTPVVIPKRIYDDNELLTILGNYSKLKSIYIITQFNHPRELTKEAEKSIKALKKNGIEVKNQAVLLRGVNDDWKLLSDLMNGLVTFGVTPYYLFQCRPVKGVKTQFQIPLDEAIKIVDEAKSNMNGLAKSFKYVLSNKVGKIEILGQTNEQFFFRYHQTNDLKKSGKIFVIKKSPNLAWLDESSESIIEQL